MTNQEAWLYITTEDKINDIKWRSTYLDENNSECVRRVQPELDIRLELMTVYEDNSTRIAHHLKGNIHSVLRVNQLLHFSNPTSSFCSSLSTLQQSLPLEPVPHLVILNDPISKTVVPSWPQFAIAFSTYPVQSALKLTSQTKQSKTNLVGIINSFTQRLYGTECSIGRSQEHKIQKDKWETQHRFSRWNWSSGTVLPEYIYSPRSSRSDARSRTMVNRQSHENTFASSGPQT